MKAPKHVVIAALVAWSALTGCSGTTGGPPPASQGHPGSTVAPVLPPRPQAIRIDGTDPCSLLTPDQQARLGVRGAKPVPAEERIGPGCRWLHSPDEPVEAYQVFRDTRSGIESSFGNSRGITVTTIAGFPAIETQSERTQLPDTQCIVAVDVAPGQTLQINYDYNGSLPMTRERACDRARPAAEMAMRTLIEQAGG